jgi:hypothetical protein
MPLTGGSAPDTIGTGVGVLQLRSYGVAPCAGATTIAAGPGGAIVLGSDPSKTTACQSAQNSVGGLLTRVAVREEAVGAGEKISLASNLASRLLLTRR